MYVYCICIYLYARCIWGLASSNTNSALQLFFVCLENTMSATANSK